MENITVDIQYIRILLGLSYIVHKKIDKSFKETYYTLLKNTRYNLLAELNDS